MSEWVSVAEAARRTAVPERSIRRYVDRHSHWLPTDRRGRALMLDAEALPTLQRIRDLYAGGLNADQVEEALSQALPRTLVAAATDRHVAEPMTETIQRMAAEIQETRRLMERMIEEQERRDRELQQWLDSRLPPAEAKRMGLIARLKRMLGK